MTFEDEEKKGHLEVKAPAKGDLRIETELLRAETRSEALRALTEKALEAKADFYPRYWYCSDLIVRYAKTLNRDLQNEEAAASFREIFRQGLRNLEVLWTAFKKLLNLQAKPFPKALFSGLNLEDEGPFLARLESMQSEAIIPALLSAGVSSPERLAWIATFVMIRISRTKPEAAPRKEMPTLPLERALNTYLKQADVPLLLADYVTFAEAL